MLIEIIALSWILEWCFLGRIYFWKNNVFCNICSYFISVSICLIIWFIVLRFYEWWHSCLSFKIVSWVMISQFDVLIFLILKYKSWQNFYLLQNMLPVVESNILNGFRKGKYRIFHALLLCLNTIISSRFYFFFWLFCCVKTYKLAKKNLYYP